MKTHRIVSVMLCTVAVLVVTAFAGKPPAVPDPTGLVVSDTTPSSITISWSSGEGTTVGFVVAYLEGTTYPDEKCTSGTQVDVGASTSYVLNDLPADTTFSFRVCAYDSKNKRSTGITVRGTTEGGLPAEAGIAYQPDAIETNDDGDTDTISVSLTKQPQGDVVINVTSTDESEGVVTPALLVFTAANWNQPQDVTVTGLGDDFVVDGDVLYDIELAVDTVATTDSDYLTIAPVDVPAVNWDTDGLIFVESEDTPMPIADRVNTTTVSQIDIFSLADVGNLEVTVDITHSKMSDLTVELQSPTSTAPLEYDGSQWKLVDPSAFQGEAVVGSWRLVILDGVRKEKGTLQGWNLRIVPLNRTYVFRSIDGLDIKAEVIRFGVDAKPGVMFIHGGALIMGNRFGIHTDIKNALLENGYVIVSVDYRLAPERKLPDIIDDLLVAHGWISDNGSQLFNVLPDKLGIMGQSGGAFLTQLMGYHLPARPPVLVSFWGYSDITMEWITEPSQWYLTQQPLVSEEEALSVVGDVVTDGVGRWPFYLYTRQQGTWPEDVTGFDPVADADIYHSLFCPLSNVTADYPPCIFVHGDQDTDVDYQQSVLMNAALADSSISHQLITMPGAGHGFGGVPTEDIQAYLAQVIAFMDGYLK